MAERTERRAPVRTCVGCRRRRPQDELVRIARTGEGSLVASRTMPGRGAWLCRGNPTCLDQAIRRGGFDRAFRSSIDRRRAEDLRSALAVTDDRAGTDFVPGYPPVRD